jgi:hypothetical protein
MIYSFFNIYINLTEFRKAIIELGLIIIFLNEINSLLNI